LAKLLGENLARLLDPAEFDDEGGYDGEVGFGPHPDFERAIERNNSLAAAVGACVCWGQHVDCTICEGRGRPGWTLPDKRLFAQYVRPAIETIREQKRAANEGMSDDGDGNGE